MGREREMARGGFGRRRSLQMEDPSFAVRADQLSWRVAPMAGQISPLKLMGSISLALLALICLEAMMSGTSLITPINAAFLNIMRGIGFVLGIPLAILVVVKPHMPMGILKKLAILLFLPVLVGFAADRAAWRIADWIEFGFSSEQFAPASYPIKYASHGRRGRRDSFEIDPFDLKNGTAIAVRSAQFDAVWPNHSDFCITVMQRRSVSGAIEILNDGVFTLYEPAPATLTPCPEARREQELRRQFRP